MSDEEQNYMAALERLWDMLSDAVEGGRLTVAEVPDDYDAFVAQMIGCARHQENVRRELAEEGN